MSLDHTIDYSTTVITVFLVVSSTSLLISSIVKIDSLHPLLSSSITIVYDLCIAHSLSDYPISSISSMLLSMSSNYQLKYQIMAIANQYQSIASISTIAIINTSNIEFILMSY